jgi:hypothetical protein
MKFLRNRLVVSFSEAMEKTAVRGPFQMADSST